VKLEYKAVALADLTAQSLNDLLARSAQTTARQIGELLGVGFA